MDPSAITPTDRALAALHVGYELRQLAGAALRIDDADDEVTGHALLESTLIHARNLIEFLTGRDGWGKDIRADQLCPDWKLTDADAIQALTDRLDAIDKHLAHLSWRRVLDMPQQWPYPRIVRELVDHMRSYHAAMLEARVAFANAIGDELEKIDRTAPLVWTSETAYSDVETTTSPTSITMTRTVDPLALTDFAAAPDPSQTG